MTSAFGIGLRIARVCTVLQGVELASLVTFCGVCGIFYARLQSVGRGRRTHCYDRAKGC